MKSAVIRPSNKRILNLARSVYLCKFPQILGYRHDRILTGKCKSLDSKPLKAMLHEAMFLGTCLATNVARKVARNISRVTPQFCNLQCNKMLPLRVARKVEISSTFLNVAIQVAACDMSTATCNAIL